ncbi:MAG: imidazoleglycerol-phosphate dehydratase [Kiritimatiellia bacterium]|jgi:imidazoleglycerol-phosphate dehydratase
MSERTATIQRDTRETQIHLTLNLDGTGQANIDTGVPFFNHMLELLTKHALIDLDVKATGDLDVDYHHTVEDVGLVLGQALNQALGDRKGIRRYGHALLPMDEALARVAIDLGGRPYLVFEVNHPERKILDFDLGLLEEFFRAFITEGRLNLHAAHLYGKDVHHAYESIFKGVAKALDMALTRDPRVQGVPSSKGTI